MDGPEGLLTPPVTRTPEVATSADPTTALIDSLRREVESAKTAAQLESTSSNSVAAQPARTRTSHTGAPAATGTAVAVKSAPATSSPVPADVPAGADAYGVGVASYLDEVRANTERDRYAADTALPATVMPYNDAGTTMFRVVVGRWASSNEADRNANALMERGLINEARVVQLPKK